MNLHVFLFRYEFWNPFLIIFWAMLSQQQSFSKAFYQIAYFKFFSKQNYRTFGLGNLFLKKATRSKVRNVVGAHKSL